MKSSQINVQYDAIGESGLRFFGKVSASIAHEIKNVLAIINENTGLLEDLSAAAQHGTTIDPGRLNKACQQFTKQIQRADRIMKNMSRFAHSVDEFSGQINLHELTVLVANLVGRLAAMRTLTIQVEPPPTPVIFPGNPFAVQNLVWICLEFAFETASAGSTLLLTPSKEGNNITLRMGGIDNLSDGLAAENKDLILALGAELSVDYNTKELILHLT